MWKSERCVSKSLKITSKFNIEKLVPNSYSDVETLPEYSPPYARSHTYGRSYAGRKNGYSGRKTYSGSKTVYSGTKNGHSGTKTDYTGRKTGYTGPNTGYSGAGFAPPWQPGPV